MGNSTPSQQSLLYTQLITHSDQLNGDKLIQYQQMAALIQSMINKLKAAIDCIKSRMTSDDVRPVNDSLKKVLLKFDMVSFQHITSIGYIIQQLCRVACNSVTITNGELLPLGIAIYPMLSSINHSCDPNSVLVFTSGYTHQTTVSLRSIREVSADEQITIPYIDIGNSTINRRNELLTQYYFTCYCSRCIEYDSSIDTQTRELRMTSYKCNDDTCLGTLQLNKTDNVFQCNICHTKQGDAELNSLTNKINSLSIQHNNTTNIHDQSIALNKKSVLALVPYIDVNYNITLLRLLNSLSRDSIQCEYWNDALIYHTAELRIMNHVYPSEIHPVIGIQHFLIAKLCWLLMKTDCAVQHWRIARSILIITHGPSHSLLDSIDVSIQEAYHEVEYKAEQYDTINVNKLNIEYTYNVSDDKLLTQQLIALCSTNAS